MRHSWLPDVNGLGDLSRLDAPFIEPHSQPRLLEPLRQPAHARLVLRVVAQEDVVGEGRARGTRVRRPRNTGGRSRGEQNPRGSGGAGSTRRNRDRGGVGI